MENKPTKQKSVVRQTKKTHVLEELRKTPIVEVACRRASVSRATFYRWRGEDAEFKKAAEEALSQGAELVNDLAESQLLSAIREGNLTAIIYWLNHRHPEYKDKQFRSALTIAQDQDNNIYFELFGTLKPETERLIGPKEDSIENDSYEGK